MVFNVTFNNISVISWWSILLVEETDKLDHIVLYQVHLAIYNRLGIGIWFIQVKLRFSTDFI
jgi:hypothetical protein